MDLRENKYIKFPIQLEQYLMEGTYRKVEEVHHTRPCPLYAAANSPWSACVRARTYAAACKQAKRHLGACGKCGRSSSRADCLRTRASEQVIASAHSMRFSPQAQKGLPAPSYAYFVSKLSGTVRDSIADRSASARSRGACYRQPSTARSVTARAAAV